MGVFGFSRNQNNRNSSSACELQSEREDKQALFQEHQVFLQSILWCQF